VESGFRKDSCANNQTAEKSRTNAREVLMAFTKRSIAALALLAALALPVLDAMAHDESKYPDWSGQWRRPRGLATQWDQDKPAGVAQQAPLKPEYQKMLEWSIADQASGARASTLATPALPTACRE